MTTEPLAAPVTALFAAAIFQARAGLVDPVAMGRSIELLAAAAGDGPITVESRGANLLLNGVPLAADAPGAALLQDALRSHHTSRLTVPASLGAAQWRELIDLFASAPGLYDSIDDLRDALRGTVPDAIVSGQSATGDEIDLRDALFELPGLRAASNEFNPVEPEPDPHAEELAQLDTGLNALLHGARAARAERNYPRLAESLIQVVELERQQQHDDLRAVVLRDRRRVFDTETLENMAHQMAGSANPAVLARALGGAGRDGADALMIALSGASTPAARRLYIDALADCRDCDDAIIAAFSDSRAQVNRDAAEIAGRKRMARAVPMLAQLLKHRDTGVRTAAWHALELIGTREATRALGN